jgi:hypothetical protein
MPVVGMPSAALFIGTALPSEMMLLGVRLTLAGVAGGVGVDGAAPPHPVSTADPTTQNSNPRIVFFTMLLQMIVADATQSLSSD